MVCDACCRLHSAQKTLYIYVYYSFSLSLAVLFVTYSRIKYTGSALETEFCFFFFVVFLCDLYQTNTITLAKHLPRIHWRYCVYSCYFCSTAALFLRVFFFIAVVAVDDFAAAVAVAVFFYIVVVFFHFLLATSLRKITRCMHSRNMCVFFFPSSSTTLLFVGFVIFIMLVVGFYYSSEMRAYCVRFSLDNFLALCLALRCTQIQLCSSCQKRSMHIV